MSRDAWGQGNVYRPKNTRRWYIRYPGGDGKIIREKTGSRKKRVAQALLVQRLSERAAGTLLEPQARKTTLDILLGLVQTDYEINGRRSLKRMKELAAGLKAYFGATTPVLQLTETRLDAYIRDRLADKKAPATVNRHLGLLRRAFRLGRRKKLVQAMPSIVLLAEDNARQGFFESAELDAVLGHLAPPLQAVVRFAHLSGWRLGEILTLQWADVDREGRAIRLRPEHSKNRSARVLALEGELSTLIEHRWAARSVIDAQGQAHLVPHVFHRRGKAIKEFRGAWRKACEKANVPGRLFHDLRRTAVRNMERAGVPRSVAMKITGHKTEAIYRRYAIVNEQDLRDALHRMEAHRAAEVAVAGATASPPATGGVVVPLAGARRGRRLTPRGPID